MPDTLSGEAGSEGPRDYSPAELDTLKPLFEAVGVEFSPAIVEQLQEAVHGFQWATSADPGGIFFSCKREKCYRLKRILKLHAAQRPPKKIELALRGLDGPTLQQLGRVRAGHPRLPTAIRRVLKTIPIRGPDPERSHRQFIRDLKRIVAYAGERPGRCVRVEECGPYLTQKDYGPFRDLVKAAIRPFDPTRECDWDIRAVLYQRKRAHRKRKNAVLASG